MELPEIIKDRMDMEINDQVSITLFPDDEGQPKCDVIKLNLKEIENKVTSLFLTPCEALEMSSALAATVQFYLYNQEQYRKEILSVRIEESDKREKSCEEGDPEDIDLYDEPDSSIDGDVQEDIED